MNKCIECGTEEQTSRVYRNESILYNCLNCFTDYLKKIQKAHTADKTIH